jgi:hypothetical protein
VFPRSLETDEHSPYRGGGADYTPLGGVSMGDMGMSRTAGDELETRNWKLEARSEKLKAGKKTLEARN